MVPKDVLDYLLTRGRVAYFYRVPAVEIKREVRPRVFGVCSGWNVLNPSSDQTTIVCASSPSRHSIVRSPPPFRRLR